MSNTDSETTTIDATDGCCGDNERDADTDSRDSVPLCRNSTTASAADRSSIPAEHTHSSPYEAERGTGHWLGDIRLDQQLPDDLQTALERFLGAEPVDTLAKWAEQIHQLTGGGSIDVDHLCHASEETAHWGEVHGERHHFQCFYDAVILAALTDEPVDIHTVSPDGTVVKAHAVGSEELSVTPDTAVFSLGIALDAHQQSSGNPTLQDGYGAICPYVKAFPDRDAYEMWADDVPAATVATPLAGATVFARTLATEGDDG